ncbi:MAG: chemotaxis protein CheW, partial [Chlamydiia bacterium]|nr:chemotaxis protein CheW [Chlamydiia bacterium]
ITSEIQMAVMGTRMQPIGKAFNKFTRIVRDLARSLDKKITLRIIGQEVELDKSIIEALGDPLVHLVRNSVDHGLETPSERRENGKDETGTITLKASHQAGMVFIEVIDDGRGIDPQKVKKKALETGNFAPEKIERMKDKDLLRLIFEPGFSLAPKVTEISGRGVGMDVVHSNLSRYGGVIDVESNLGQGTTLRIRLPLTLAVLSCITFEVGGLNYLLPQNNITELMQIPPFEVKTRVHLVDGRHALNFRDKLIPLIRLSDVLTIPRSFRDPETRARIPDRRFRLHDRRANQWQAAQERLTDAEEPKGTVERQDKDRRFPRRGALRVAIVNNGSFNFGLVVDEFIGSEEIVVKPLGKYLKVNPCYAGTTIQGNGKVAMILDLQGLTEYAGLQPIGQGYVFSSNFDEDKGDLEPFFVVRNSPKEQFAIARDCIQRVELVERANIQVLANRRAMEYEGKLLPLLSLEQLNNIGPLQQNEQMFVLVFNIANREVGLLVSDMPSVEYLLLGDESHSIADGPVIGSVLVNGQMSSVLDLFLLVNELCPDWDVWKQLAKRERPKSILVVDDSKFYRDNISGFLKTWGFDVSTATDGLDAIQLLETQGDQFDMVLTDIEMPNMNGIQLTQEIRKRKQFGQLPIIAISSLDAGEMIQQAYTAGVDKYLIKLDRASLVNHVLDQFEEKRSEPVRSL